MVKKSLTLVPTGSAEHRCVTFRLDDDGLELLLIPIEANAPLVEVRLASDAVAALRELLGVSSATVEKRERKLPKQEPMP